MPNPDGSPTLQDYQSQVADAIKQMQLFASSASGGSLADAQSKIQSLQQLNQTLDSIQRSGMDISSDPTLQGYIGQVTNLGVPAGQIDANLGKLNDYVTLQGQAKSQNKAFQDLTTQQNAAYDTARTNILASIPGYADTINQNLIGQEQTAMTALEPQIESRLNALGLLTSGALPYAQAQTQSQLDLNRQQQVGNFETGAIGQAGIGIPLQALNTDIGNLSAATSGDINATQNAVSRDFSLQDIYNQEQFQLKAQQAALDAARAAGGGSKDNTLGDIMGGIGAAVSIGAAPFTGGASLAGLPSSVGMIAGGSQGGAIGSNLSSTFGAAGQGAYNYFNPSSYQYANIPTYTTNQQWNNLNAGQYVNPYPANNLNLNPYGMN